MSEKEPQINSPESAAERAEDNAEQREKLKEVIEKAKNESESEDSIEKLRSKVEQESISGKEKPVGELQKDKKQPSIRIDKQVKNKAYKDTIKKTQRRLPRRQRAFSKIIHQPTIEAVSEFGSKTVARPSALLSSGIFALVGTSLLVWITRYYGFRYNFFMYVAFLVLGFLVGLAVEAIWKTVKGKASS